MSAPTPLDPIDQAILDLAAADYQRGRSFPMAEPVEPDDEPDDLRPTLAGWLLVAFVAAAMFISAAALVWIAAAVIVAITHVPMWFGVVTVVGVVGLVVWAAMEKAR